MTRAWILPVPLVLGGSVVATSLALEGRPGSAVALLLMSVLIAGRA